MKWANLMKGHDQLCMVTIQCIISFIHYTFYYIHLSFMNFDLLSLKIDIQ